MMSGIDGVGAGQTPQRPQGPEGLEAKRRADAASFDAEIHGEGPEIAPLSGQQEIAQSAEAAQADALRDLLLSSIERGESRDETMQCFVRHELESSLGPDLPTNVVEDTIDAFRHAPELRQLFEQIYSRAQEA
jgi:hypothetical protein